jgi:hypothetical protein
MTRPALAGILARIEQVLPAPRSVKVGLAAAGH